MSSLRMVLLALILGTLAGCGGGAASKSRKLVLAVPASEELRPVLLSMIEEFESKHPRIKVQLMEIPGNYYQKVLVMIAGRTPPDIMWMGQSFAEFAVKGVFLDLTERLAADPDIHLDEYAPQVLDWYKLNGQQLGVPYGVDVGFIAYNKDLFRKRGVPFPKSDWTVDDFLKAAKKLTYDEDGDGKTDVYGFAGRIYFAAFGAELLTKDKKHAACDSPEMLDSIKFNLNLVYKWHVSPPPEMQIKNSTAKMTFFHQRKVAMTTFETYHLPFIREQCVDIDWDIVMIPKAVRRGYWASSNAYLISKDVKNPDDAWLFLKEFQSERFMKTMASATIPANLRIARKVYGSNRRPPEHLSDLLGTFGHLYPYPRVPNLQELMHFYWLDLSKVYAFYDKPSMHVSPEEAMKRAAARINKIIERNQKRLR